MGVRRKNGSMFRVGLGFASMAVACSPKPAPATAEAPSERTPHYESCAELRIVNAKLYARPDAVPTRSATLRLSGGKVLAVQSQTAKEKGGPCVLDARGRVVTAGYWNSHVHLADPAFNDEASAARRIEDMLLSRGFTSVVDTGADLGVLQKLQAAIFARRFFGPRIVIAGGGFVYENGTPSYLPKGLLPELSSPEQARELVREVLDSGVDGIKIFSGSFQTPTHTIHLPEAIIRALAEVAHERGAFVVSHPTDLVGVVRAVDNGVDVLAHTAPPAGKLEPELIARMLKAHVALTPTLALWRWELERHEVPEAAVLRYENWGIGQLRDYHSAGGEVLFGTDVGYMQDFDTTREFALMQRAGLDYRDILRALTVAPARRFARANQSPDLAGVLAPGADADLVVLAADPADDVSAFAHPVVTVVAGRVAFASPDAFESPDAVGP